MKLKKKKKRNPPAPVPPTQYTQKVGGKLSPLGLMPLRQNRIDKAFSSPTYGLPNTIHDHRKVL